MRRNTLNNHSKVNERLQVLIPVREHDEMVSVAVVLTKLDREDGAGRIDSLFYSSNDDVNEIESVLQEVIKQYPYFEGVFEELPSLNQLKSANLKHFWFEFKNMMEEVSDIADWYEKFLEQYLLAAARMEGTHATPTVVNKLAIQLLNARQGTFQDGMCGLGGSLKTAADYAAMHNGSVELYGQEINSKAWAIAKIRMYINGYEDATIYQGDLLMNPQFINENHLQKFDYSFTDTPFGMHLRQPEALEMDRYNRFRFGIPTKRSSELAVLSHVIASLKEDGKAVVVVPSGTLFRSGTEAQVRKNVYSADLIEAVIALPSGLYDTTAIASNLIYINKNKAPEMKNKIIFINADDKYTEISRGKRTMSQPSLDLIVDTVQNSDIISEFSTVIDIKDIQNDDLLPNRYVAVQNMEITGFGSVEFSLEQFKDVETAPLKDLVTFFRGVNVSSKDEDPEGEHKVVRISDVQDGMLIKDNIAQYNVVKSSKLEPYRLYEGDVIITIRGQTIKVAYIDENDQNLLLSQNFMGIRCGNNLHPMYLKMYLESPVGQFLLSSKLTGTAVLTLNKKELENLEIPLKSIQQQKAMVTVYLAKKQDLEQKIKEMKRELFESKLDVYDQMGIRELFTIQTN